MYEAYAAVYDAIGQGAFAEALVARLLAALPAAPHRALDLACGTGAATLALAAAGVEVVGVDRSPQMLGIAQARARDRGLHVTFVEADIRFLPVLDEGTKDERRPGLMPVELSPPVFRRSSYDLITCFYDSLNYLTGDGELEQVFVAAAALLAPGGRLVFDLNTAHEFAAWDDVDQVVYDAGGIFVYNRLSYDRAARLAHGRIVWFVREDERWWRGEETHVERAWSDAEVAAALRAADLTLVARRTPLWEPVAPAALRVVYEVVKRSLPE